MITDADNSVCESYGIWIEKSLIRPQIYGDRARYLSDRQGSPDREDLAQGKGRRSCRGSSGGGTSTLVISVAAAARNVLLTSEPSAKIFAARAVARACGAGICYGRSIRKCRMNRHGQCCPRLFPANRMPKRGRAGSVRARTAMLHALAHIEYGAINLAFDMIGRFGNGAPACLCR